MKKKKKNIDKKVEKIMEEHRAKQAELWHPGRIPNLLKNRPFNIKFFINS